MREILFRGKAIDSGEWVYGGYYVIPDGEGGAIHRIAVSDCERFEYNDVVVDPSSISEFIGLTDKNGKKIFEGDIVFLHDYIIGEIVFECGTFGIGACKPFDYDQLEDKIASITGCYNSPNFCYNDNFISLWELYWNYNQDDNILEVVEVFGNIHDNFELFNNSELLEDKL